LRHWLRRQDSRACDEDAIAFSRDALADIGDREWASSRSARNQLRRLYTCGVAFQNQADRGCRQQAIVDQDKLALQIYQGDSSHKSRLPRHYRWFLLGLTPERGTAAGAEHDYYQQKTGGGADRHGGKN